MPIYNLTTVGDNVTGLLSFTQSVNAELMGGMLGLLFLGVVVIISLMTFLASTNDASKAFAASSFIGIGMGILLFTVNLINFTMLIAVMLLCSLAIALISKTSG